MLKSLIYRAKKELLFLYGKWKSKNTPTEKMNQPIDFVVTWVDGNDPKWLAEKRKYEKDFGIAHSADNGEERSRDWDVFQYWFRAVEKYAPWVRNVYFVTCGQVPDWMNINAPKLKVVSHTDYIPAEYLPTFSANPIEINFHRIEGLSEYVVYFNDDMFLNCPVEPEDFFRGGYPNYTAIAKPLKCESSSAFYYMQFTALGLINNIFKGKISRAIRKNPEKWFAHHYGKQVHYNMLAFEEDTLLGMCFPHLGVAFRKSTLQKVWECIPESMHETSTHKFRTPKDVLHQVVSIWEMLEGSFNAVSYEHHGKLFWDPVRQREEIVDAIIKEKYRMICINDSEAVSREEYFSLKKEIKEAFEKAFPKKSSYEK